MKTGFIRVFVGIVIAAFVYAAAYAQDNKIRAAAGDRYVISAKAGGINETDGSVTVRRTDGTSGHLIKGDDLNIGDQVWTDTSGKAEVLLNPGSYLRVGPGTAFQFTNTSLDDLRLKLATGSAIFEVIADDDFRVTVLMPRTAVALTRSGVYRIDILPDQSSKVSVLKGKIYFGTEGRTVIKSGRSATIAGINANVQKFDKDDRDDLTVWSKDRAKELAKANAGLQRSAMRNTLVNSFNRGWNLYDSFGLWVFNPTRRYWCFLPFGSGWGSPYGYYYDFDLWTVRLPPMIYTQPPSGTPTGPRTPPSTTPGTPPSGPPTSRGDTTSRRDRLHAPPFMRVQNRGRANGDAAVGGSDGGFRNTNQSAPIYSGSGSAAPSVQPSAPSAPREPVAPRGIMNRKGIPDN